MNRGRCAPTLIGNARSLAPALDSHGGGLHPRLRSVIVLYEVGAGALSLVKFVTSLGSQSVSARGAVLVTALLVASVASIVAGVLLYRGEERGRRLSLVVQALQIPRLTLPGLAYGLAIGVEVRLRLSGGLLGLDGAVHSALTLAFGSHGLPLYLGINLLSLVVFLRLMRGGRATVTPPERSVEFRAPAV